MRIIKSIPPMDPLFLIKFVVTAVVVIAMSLVTEYLGPRWAGLLSGLPTGSAITLYFFALEHGVQFAGESAVYNLVGIVAMQTTVFGYYLFGVWFPRAQLLMSMLGGLVGYLAGIVVLRQFEFTTLSAALVAACSIAGFTCLFRRIVHTEIARKVKITMGVIVLRAVVAAALVVLVTWASHFVDSSLAGLFSAFPVTVFPLLIIIQFSYGTSISNSVIKHLPKGLIGLMIYSILISMVYPSFSLYSGMLIAFGGTFVYLFGYLGWTRWQAAQARRAP